MQTRNEGGVMDIQKEREAFQKFCEKNFDFENHEQTYFDDQTQCYENDAGEDTASINMAWSAWQAAKAQKVAVPEIPKRQGGYYIRDLRRQSGNSMRFWYQAGYGTKHKNFFWCETLEEAKKYKGSCDWFEIWHAPYIDSLVEYTVDFQLADRSVGFVDLKAQEQVG